LKKSGSVRHRFSLQTCYPTDVNWCLSEKLNKSPTTSSWICIVSGLAMTSYFPVFLWKMNPLRLNHCVHSLRSMRDGFSTPMSFNISVALRRFSLSPLVVPQNP
jgi:hypothetical protein